MPNKLTWKILCNMCCSLDISAHTSVWCILYRALLNEHHIPESRQKELQAGVAEYCLCVPEELTESIIQDVAQLDTRLERCVCVCVCVCTCMCP